MKLRILGTPVPLGAAANMGWTDETAHDGKGGWTDAGPEDDGRYLERTVQREVLFNGYPFSLNTGAKSLLVMNHPEHFQGGPKTVSLRLQNPVKARYLYILHTASWMSRNVVDVARITVTFASGKNQEFTLRNLRDLANWTHCISSENAKIAVRAKSALSSDVALYASRFTLDPQEGAVQSIQLEILPGGPIWIIAGLTLSDEDFVKAESQFRIGENETWKPLIRDAHNRRLAGSALDLTPFRDNFPCGAQGRVIVTPDGHFAFEKQPEKHVRFFTNTIAIGYLRDHHAIDTYVEELCKNGFNMLRLHFLDLNLVRKMKKPGEFDQEMWDCFEYLVARCKEKGIYLNMDCMTNLYGYDPGEPWGRKGVVEHKSRLYFEPEVREQWSQCVRKLLTKVNPYTKTRLVDDPVLAMVIGYNEQEFAFIRRAPVSALPVWRDFLKNRYGTIKALRSAWGEKADNFKSFDDIPLYSTGVRTLEQDADVAAFALKMERECMQFYRRELGSDGYKGPVSGYNMLGNKHYLLLRRDFDYVSKNSYEMLPTKYSRPGSILTQSSSISNCSKMLRNSLASRYYGKPFFVTEYGIPFWNRHRYEVPYTLGAYAAFQDFDGLAAFGDSYSYATVKTIHPVRIFMDPVNIANEYLTFFLFGRGDVSPAKKEITIRCYEEEITAPRGDRGSPRMEEGLYGLMTKVCWEVASKEQKAQHKHLVIKAGKSSASLVSALHAGAADTAVAANQNPASVLRKNGVIGPENRSDGVRRFESENSELFLNAGKSFMRIRTPRFQGICGTAGTVFSLPDFKIKQMSAEGSMSLVALDGLKPIRQAERLMLVYVTNALNSGMEFDSPEMRMIHKLGGLPTLLKCANFTVAIRNQNAASLKLYPLDLQGNRLKTINPVSVQGEFAEFQINTAKDGPAIFFELAVK